MSTSETDENVQTNQWFCGHSLVRTLKAHLLKNGSLPDVLYLQLDNASSSNKNRFVLFFCGLLVAWKLVRKVKVSFLPVGHTHEDIDQMFSRFASALRRNDVMSWQHMAEIFKGAFHFDGQQPAVEFLHNVYDYKAWMTPFVPPMKYHTDPMCFKFTLNETGDSVRVFARRTMAGSKHKRARWQPDGGYSLVSVAQAQELLQAPLPRVAPRAVDFGPLRKTLAAYAKAGVLDEVNVQRWDAYMTSVEDDVSSACDECSRLRMLEASYSVVKTDSDDERKEKNNKRREVQNELLSHRAETAHQSVCPKSVLPIQPDDPVADDQVDPGLHEAGEPVPSSSDDDERPLQFMVGKVPKHLQARLHGPKVGDLVALKCVSEDGDQSQPEFALGKLVGKNDDGLWQLHWYDRSSRSGRIITARWFPCWNESDDNENWYAAKRPQKADHLPLVQAAEYDFADWGFTLTKNDKLAKSSVKRFCAYDTLPVQCKEKERNGSCGCAGDE